MTTTSTLCNFYKCQNVLVCGASGMTGRNLFNKLQDYGAYVLGTQHSKNIDGLVPCDLEKFEDALWLTKNQRFVFICCAKTYNLKTCQENPQSMILPNIKMVSNILEACRINKVRRVLYVSSATVYQPSFKVLAEEDLDWNKNPADVYMGVGWVKRYIEKLCEFYSSKELEILTVRPTNIYGAFDKCDSKVQHVVPAFIERALNKEDPFFVYGTGKAIKDFIYVDDLVRDLLRIMAGYNTPDPINVCSEELVSIEDLAKIVVKAVGYDPEIICVDKGLDPVPFKAISRNKLDSILGKETYVPLTYGIEKAVEWFSSLRQIASN